MNTDGPLSTIAPRLYELEQERFNILEENKKEMVYGVLAFFSCALLLYFFWLKPANHQVEISTFIMAIVVLAVLSNAIVVYLRNNRVELFKEKVKSDLITEILNTIDPHLVYTAKGDIHQHQFAASGIFYERLSRYSCEDSIQGQLDGIPFHLAEVKAEKKIRKNAYRTYFHGPFLIIKLPRTIAGETYILPANYSETFSNWVSRKLWGGGRAGEKIKIHGHHFNRTFRVISNNPKGARGLLTDKLIVAIQRLPPKTYLSIIQSNMYLAIDNRRDLLKIDVQTSLLKQGTLKSLREELELLTEIVKNLDLKNHNWNN